MTTGDEEERAKQAIERLTDVMSRIPVDIGKALHPENVPAMAQAVAACAECTDPDACRVWIDGHEEGSRNLPPDFCRNWQYIRTHWPKPR